MCKLSIGIFLLSLLLFLEVHGNEHDTTNGRNLTMNYVYVIASIEDLSYTNPFPTQLSFNSYIKGSQRYSYELTGDYFFRMYNNSASQGNHNYFGTPESRLWVRLILSLNYSIPVGATKLVFGSGIQTRIGEEALVVYQSPSETISQGWTLTEMGTSIQMKVDLLPKSSLSLSPMMRLNYFPHFFVRSLEVQGENPLFPSRWLMEFGVGLGLDW